MRHDDGQAFHEIYDRYWFRLYVSTLKRLKSTEDAKDLVQDLFVSLWTKRHVIVIGKSLSSYLFAAAKYKVINHIEANIVKGSYLKSLESALSAGDTSTSETIIQQDLEQFAHLAISNLSPKMRQVFELSRRENLSNNEIAGRLNISEQTVKNQISKALKILRMRIGDISATLPFFIALFSCMR
jgi:RNA polymerase sigma-70 factor (ECF subfamily)